MWYKIRQEILLWAARKWAVDKLPDWLFKFIWHLFRYKG